MKVAALDLGSNTFICLIAEVAGGRVEKIIEDRVEVVRLGQEIGGGRRRFHPDALERAQKCLEKFAALIAEQQPQRVLAMATAAARDVENADELLDMGAKLGIPIEIIPGAREAEITYLGAISGLDIKNQSLAILDVGGGSTEIILGMGSQMSFGRSFNFGCVKLTERFLPKQPPRQEEMMRMDRYIETEILSALPEIERAGIPDILLAVAGTPTELARVAIGGEFDARKIDGYELTRAQLLEWKAKFAGSSVEKIHSTYGVSAGRADLILSGTAVLERFCALLKKDKIQVSTRGVRYGVALEILRREKSTEEK